MDLILSRQEKRPDGIFSFLTTTAGDRISTTLEHAYACQDGSYRPKIPAGTYRCVRGTHALHDGVPFVTFEITGVPDHSGLLFHIGNFNCDSEGCVLTGSKIGIGNAGSWMVVNSKDAFLKFLQLQDGLDEFMLTVQD